MFFKIEKKIKKENETMSNAVFGELEFIDCAWEGDSVSSLFGEEKTIGLYVYDDPQFEKMDQGGMGVILARMRSKEMIYNRINGSNVLTMVFDTGCILP